VNLRLTLAFAALVLSSPVVLPAQEPIHHELTVAIHPAEHRIEVTDTLTVPSAGPGNGTPAIEFRLHGDLEVRCADPAFVLEAVGETERPRNPLGVPTRRYRLSATGAGENAAPKVRLHYSGFIHHPLVRGMESARSFSRSPGLIDEKGVVLSESAHWFPSDGRRLLTFRMTVELPAGWDAVSQGKRVVQQVSTEGRRRVIWDCAKPTDDVYLIAGRFTEYARPAGAVTAYAFLRGPDPNLAGKYLEATAQYLEMYGQLIGPYPYAKFALVENFWETGYGMPSFTLLGPKIIRFPWILHSSYPHEILHNWWGNSVFVDYGSGNWCEGLTAYLADHLIKEGRGQGTEYRRDTLKKYRNYVREKRDFPLTEFRSRHSGATEAVGYGKSLMLFHMLRRELGDATFVSGIRRFYREYRFKRASFDDLARVFSRAAGRNLVPFFDQWVKRPGAPELALGDVVVAPAAAGHRARVVVRQVQKGPVYRVTVPIGFTLEGRADAAIPTLALTGREGTLEVDLPARPLRVELDPEFDVFRRLDRREIPPSIGQLFGAERLVIVVPETGDPAVRDGWRAAAEQWARGLGGRARIVAESELASLPESSAVWVLGAANRWRTPIVSAIERFGAGVDGEDCAFGAARVPRKDHCFVFTAAHPKDADLAVGWMGTARADALPGLARKLPHYGKYSYVAFSGAEPTNVAKGQWPAVGSPLTKVLADDGRAPPEATYPAREPLAQLGAVFDPERLMGHVRALSAESLEGRGVGTPGLDRASDYIVAAFEAAGLKPGGENGGWYQTWSEPGGPDGKSVRLRNVIGVLPGKRAGWEEQSVVIGAHYDHLGRGWPDVRSGNEGKIHPGADDNASGVAVLLEVAALLGHGFESDRTLVFAAFSGEEWALKGSRHYVQAMKRWPASQVMAMINIDTVGRLEGRKLTVLGTGSAREWIHIAMGIGFTTGVESECVADDLGSSDQKSFLDAGVPAVQVFAGPHADYHRPTDTADKVDAAGLVKTATFVREAAVYLSQREAPLTSQLSAKRGAPPGRAPAPPGRPGGRRASLGTRPDFQYRGPGVRISGVTEGSPAEAAGLEANDVLLAIDGKPVEDLRGYAGILRAKKPGDVITIRLRRGEQELTVKAKLTTR